MSKPIESYADKKHCEMCGALITEEGIDQHTNHASLEVIRRLAFVAEKCPSLALLMIYHVAGRSERDIAKKIHVSHVAVHNRICKARRTILALQNM
jgi:hypothetical protein